MNEKPSEVRIREEIFPDARGVLARMLTVQFMVGQHGPFTMRFPADNTPPTEIRRKLEDFARDIGMVSG